MEKSPIKLYCGERLASISISLFFLLQKKMKIKYITWAEKKISKTLKLERGP